MKKEQIVKAITENFRTFGGGNGSSFNPIAEALKDLSPQFAAGVDINDVVEFVLMASSAPELLEALKEAEQQIIYLHAKFRETGSGNKVLSIIKQAIQKAEQ